MLHPLIGFLNDATLQQAQELWRHKNIATTEIYAHNIDATKILPLVKLIRLFSINS